MCEPLDCEVESITLKMNCILLEDCIGRKTTQTTQRTTSHITEPITTTRKPTDESTTSMTVISIAIVIVLIFSFSFIIRKKIFRSANATASEECILMSEINRD